MTNGDDVDDGKGFGGWAKDPQFIKVVGALVTLCAIGAWANKRMEATQRPSPTIQTSMVAGPMTRDQATQAIAEALEAMHAAYWAVCDTEGQPVNPAVLLAPDGALDDAFDIALSVEAFAQERGISWSEARERS